MGRRKKVQAKPEKPAKKGKRTLWVCFTSMDSPDILKPDKKTWEETYHIPLARVNEFNFMNVEELSAMEQSYLKDPIDGAYLTITAETFGKLCPAWIEKFGVIALEQFSGSNLSYPFAESTATREHFTKTTDISFDGCLDPNDPQYEDMMSNKQLVLAAEKMLGKAKPKKFVGSSIVAKIKFGGFEAPLSLKSVDVLKPGTYLNDEMIDFGITLSLLDVAADPSEVTVVSNYAFQLMYVDLQEEFPQKSAASLLKMWQRSAKTGNIMETKYLVIPVCRDNHWVLAIVNQPLPPAHLLESIDSAVPKDAVDMDKLGERYSTELYRKWLMSDEAPNIIIFDSLKDRLFNVVGNYQKFLDTTCEYIKRALHLIQNEFWTTTNRPYLISKRDVFALLENTYLTTLPQQPNNWDCGLFLIYYAGMWFEALKHTNGNYHDVLRTSFKHNQSSEICKEREKLRRRIRTICAVQNPALLEALDKGVSLEAVKDELDEKPVVFGSLAQLTIADS